MKRERPTDEELHRAVRNLNLQLMAEEGYNLANAILAGDSAASLRQYAQDLISAWAGTYQDIMEKDDVA